MLVYAVYYFGSVVAMSLQLAYDTFSMDPQKRRGRALIIANSVFSLPNLSERKGTQADVQELQLVFERLNFKVVVHNNLSSEVSNTLSVESK